MPLFRYCGLVALMLLLRNCGQGVVMTLQGLGPTPSPATSGFSIARLLRDPAAPRTGVDVDAYFSGLVGMSLSTSAVPSPDEVRCPGSPLDGTLTDHPFPAVLHVLDESQANLLPDDAPWLIATTAEVAQPGRLITPSFPYHARLRGHLHDPVFAHCPHADRIFVVESIVAVYEEHAPDEMAARARGDRGPDPAVGRLTLPADYGTWRRYHNAEMGYGLRYPPAWGIEARTEPDVKQALAFRSLDWPDYPVIIRVYAGETHEGQSAAATALPLLQGSSYGPFKQGWIFGQGQLKSQNLEGYRVDYAGSSHERALSVLFSAHGRTYDLALRYPLGVDAPQPLLTAYSAIVESFQLDAPPSPVPTPKAGPTPAPAR